MRILIATPYRGLWGGIEQYVHSVVPGLLGRGHAVSLLYEHPLDSSKPRIDSEGGDLPAWCSREMGLEAALSAVQAWAPELVYSQGLEENELERALAAAYPTVLYAHAYYGTCISGRKCHSWPRIEPCSRTLGPACLVLYLPRRCGGFNAATMWRLYRVQSQRKASFGQYRRVLVASRAMYQEYQRHGVGEDRLNLVPLPIEDPVENPAAPVPAAPGKDLRDYRILFVGRLMDVKGAGHLLRALPLASRILEHPLHLTIAGDGPERARLEELARRLDLKVEFTGWVDTAARSHYMQQTELLAAPSLWPEPFGMVGVEAGRYGVPSVGYAVGGIPDWLIAGQTGEIAPGDPPTSEGLAAAIARAFANPDHYRKLSSGAWELARRFNMQQHLADLESVLVPVAAAHASTDLNPHAVVPGR